MMSRYEFAKRVAEFNKCDASLVLPAKTADMEQKAKRPLDGGFVLEKIESLLERRMSSLTESMEIMASEKGFLGE